MSFAKLLAALAVLLASFAATADDKLVRFDGGIGAQPLRAGALPNDVFGVNPGGRPWVIANLNADVKTDGGIKAVGRGLLLAGGNGIGTNGGQSVRARLFCGGVASDSGLVPLDPAGNFRSDDVLTPTPASPCANPVLLIVSSGGAWFAAGIPQ